MANSSPESLARADERGSIISLTDSVGALLSINRYDEYGKPQATNAGRFQYTGQRWIGEVGLYDYKARDYVQHLGIFGQTDPLGSTARPLARRRPTSLLATQPKPSMLEYVV